MMERLLERIAVSKYKDNFILKGGFLIASMVGINMRSTLDMDTTIKGILVNRKTIEKIFTEILLIDLDDNVFFRLKNIQSIRDITEYDDFRISIEAQFFKIRVNMKTDITTGDIIIPREVDYSFKLMFEDRDISIKAYNLDTVLAEKIESILTRNVANTRARDYYDVYIILTLRENDIDLVDLRSAIREKAKERKTLTYIENNEKYLKAIEKSEYLQKIWASYSKKYPYAEGIKFNEIVDILKKVFK